MGCLRAAPTKDVPLIEVREGGFREPQPHGAVIELFEDGRVRTRQETHRLPLDELTRLLERLKSLGAFALTQEQLDAELASGIEARPSARGGSGVVTLVLSERSAGPRRTISLNQPKAYEHSQLLSAQTFYRAWQMIEQTAAAKPAEAKPANGARP